MDQQVEAACTALDEFTSAVERTFNGVTNPLQQQIGWMAPALTPQEIAAVPARLAQRIRDADLAFDETDPGELDQADLIASLPTQLTILTSNLGNLSGGNIGQAGWAYFETFNQWERTLFPTGV